MYKSLVQEAGGNDALAAQGNYRDAVERYSAAQRNAPNWGQLYLHWGQALERLDGHALAIERYRRALQLDLTDVERQSLDGCCSQ